MPSIDPEHGKTIKSFGNTKHNTTSLEGNLRWKSFKISSTAETLSNNYVKRELVQKDRNSNSSSTQQSSDSSDFIVIKTRVFIYATDSAADKQTMTTLS